MQACVIVVIGFAVGSKGHRTLVVVCCTCIHQRTKAYRADVHCLAGELKLSVLGLLFGVASSLFVALYSIYVKQKLKLVGDDHWRLLAYNSLLAVPIMTPIALVSEGAGASVSLV